MAMPKWRNNRPLWRVSSAATSPAVLSISTARGTMSARFPIGVATTYRVPAIISRSLKIHLLAIFMLAAAGCGTPAGKPGATVTPGSSIATARPEQVTRLAQDQLAEATRRHAAGDHSRALQLYRQIALDALPATARPDYFLGYADAALQEGDVLLARKLLTAPTAIALSRDFDPPRQQRWLRLRGELFGLLGETANSIAAYTELADSLPDAAQRASVEQAIWGVLRQTPTAALDKLAAETTDARLHGWYQLARAGRSAETTAATVPAPPAATGLGATTAPAAVGALERVALLLPESGTYAAAADILRDGFLAAAFTARAGGARTPDIRLYDTATADVVALYQRAASEGAQLVVGPLEPDALLRLSAQTALPVPVLSLNYLESGPPPAAINFYQFGLSVADEARAAAHSAWRAGHRAALVLAPGTDWGNRALDAFRATFEELGGSVREAARYDMALKDFTPVLRPLLAPLPGQAAPAPAAGADAAAPRRRTDIDMIFLVAHPTQGRQIKPTLDFLYAKDLPIYATSAIYTGTPDPARDADLEAIQFIASPWSLAEPAALAPHPDGELPATHRQLFALGVDSYLLHAQFTGNLPGMAQPIHGQTGTLMLDGGGRIQRTQPWARFVAGRAIPLGEPGQ